MWDGNLREELRDEIPNPRIRMRMIREWQWSLWRIVPPPLLAYLVTGTYLRFIDTPDAWQRAVGPVLTVSTFVIIVPIIRNAWFARRRKTLARMEETEKV